MLTAIAVTGPTWLLVLGFTAMAQGPLPRASSLCRQHALVAAVSSLGSNVVHAPVGKPAGSALLRAAGAQHSALRCHANHHTTALML